MKETNLLQIVQSTVKHTYSILTGVYSFLCWLYEYMPKKYWLYEM